jgi:hypothetical protein
VAPDGRIVSQAEWDANVRAWLPTEEDKAHVQSLMGRVVDRRETRGTTGMQMTTSATNVSEFRALFKQWAGITVKGIDELKAHSPVPTDLKPKQKL